MVNVISIWVKDPICSWGEIVLPHDTFGSADAVLTELCDVKRFAPSTISNLHTEIVGNDCEKHTFSIKDRYQLEHKDCNQALYDVKMFIEVR